MKTQAYFENIQKHIMTEIDKATTSIIIAVAWFTDQILFNNLCQKASHGIRVELMLMNDAINRNSGIDFAKLNVYNSRLWLIESDDENQLMHNKFCIIDNETIISGSYNWTIKAKQNYESITVINESSDLASQFLDEFIKLKKVYFNIEPENTILNYNKLIIRLETLKNSILLSDLDDINSQVFKIKSMIHNAKDDRIASISDILQNAQTQQYSEAVTSINDFCKKITTLFVYVDEEILILRLETRSLELQISSLENEIDDIEKLIYDFNNSYNTVLGELVSKILELRKEILRKNSESDPTKSKEYEKAEKEFNDFNKNYQAIKNENFFILAESEKLDLKQKYRQASKYCHPDVVAEQFKLEASKVFINLKNAYDKNDLETVNKILNDLEGGIFKNKSSEITEKEVLKIVLRNLKIKRTELEKRLNNLKDMESYKIIIDISDRNEYFNEIRNKLLQELKSFKNNG